MTDILAIISCVTLGALAIFQVTLILGAPIGKFAWGGKHTVLPMNLRIGSIISIFLYAVIAVIILSKAGLISSFVNRGVIDVAIWIIAIYFSIGVILNGMSRSRYERHLMTPVALILAVLTILVALS